ncbi:hypothetical protein M433DRAFT_6804 [Acidomyces richmondensis BFW]|nr:hypothetical protein M433DRAFT_6804 [Acidomyces richmondensis BFW]
MSNPLHCAISVGNFLGPVYCAEPAVAHTRAFTVILRENNYSQLRRSSSARLAADRRVRGRGTLSTRQALNDAPIEGKKAPPGQINHEKISVYTSRALAGERATPGQTTNKKELPLINIIRTDTRSEKTSPLKQKFNI